jgi:hypothetical protein
MPRTEVFDNLFDNQVEYIPEISVGFRTDGDVEARLSSRVAEWRQRRDYYGGDAAIDLVEYLEAVGF